MADADWARVLWPLRRAILTSYPSTDDMWSAGKVLGHDDERDGELPAQAVLLGGLLPISGASGANARQPALADLAAIGTGSSVRFGHRASIYGPASGYALEPQVGGGMPTAGMAASGTAKSGNPVLVAGQDGTNAVSLLCSATGIQHVLLTAGTAEIGKLAAGTANIGYVKPTKGTAFIVATTSGAHAAGAWAYTLYTVPAGYRCYLRAAVSQYPTTATTAYLTFNDAGTVYHTPVHTTSTAYTDAMAGRPCYILGPGTIIQLFSNNSGLNEAMIGELNVELETV